MRHGSLLNYLRRHETTLASNVGLLLDMCIQVSVDLDININYYKHIIIYLCFSLVVFVINICV